MMCLLCPAEQFDMLLCEQHCNELYPERQETELVAV